MRIEWPVGRIRRWRPDGTGPTCKTAAIVIDDIDRQCPGLDLNGRRRIGRDGLPFNRGSLAAAYRNVRREGAESRARCGLESHSDWNEGVQRNDEQSDQSHPSPNHPCSVLHHSHGRIVIPSRRTCQASPSLGESQFLPNPPLADCFARDGSLPPDFFKPGMAFTREARLLVFP